MNVKLTVATVGAIACTMACGEKAQNQNQAQKKFGVTIRALGMCPDECVEDADGLNSFDNTHCIIARGLGPGGGPLRYVILLSDGAGGLVEANTADDPDLIHVPAGTTIEACRDPNHTIAQHTFSSDPDSTEVFDSDDLAQEFDYQFNNPSDPDNGFGFHCNHHPAAMFGKINVDPN